MGKTHEYVANNQGGQPTILYRRIISLIRYSIKATLKLNLKLNPCKTGWLQSRKSKIWHVALWATTRKYNTHIKLLRAFLRQG